MQQEESVGSVVRIFDNICCLSEAVVHVDPFDGGEINTHDGPANVYHFPQPPSFLGVWVIEPDCDTTNQYVLYHTPTEGQ